MTAKVSSYDFMKNICDQFPDAPMIGIYVRNYKRWPYQGLADKGFWRNCNIESKFIEMKTTNQITNQ